MVWEQAWTLSQTTEKMQTHLREKSSEKSMDLRCLMDGCQTGIQSHNL
jgi:hypothetical protein